MKHLLVIVFMALSGPVFSQSVKKITVPEVIESLQLDTLLNEHISNMVVPSNKSVILIDIQQRFDGYHFSIGLVKTNLSVINLYGSNNNLRYFKYKEHLVFVSGPEEPYQVFVKTNKQIAFTFKLGSDFSNSELYHHYLAYGFYIYRNNKLENLIIHALE